MAPSSRSEDAPDARSRAKDLFVSHETYAPRHRAAPVSKHRAAVATKTFRMPSIPTPQLRMPEFRMPELRVPAAVAGVPAALANPQTRRIAVASSIAVAATGVAVATGVAGSNVGTVQLASASASTGTGGLTAVTDLLDNRPPALTRSLDRLALANTSKAAALSGATGSAVTQTADLTPKPAPIPAPTSVSVSPGTAQAIALELMPSYGMNPADFSCINRIWTQESGWNVHSANRSSGAYGIPQALPGSKMASAGPDWQNNATTQIKWGLGYIKGRYGTPCNALAFKLSHGWY